MIVDTPVYLDNSASAPLRPEVLEAMLPYLRGSHGNPSSLHQDGREARDAVDQARQMLAASDLPVASIGYRCGYLNNASFTRAFSRRFGIAPTQLRLGQLAA